MNKDRHLNNFGVVCRADTLLYQGAAPIYDSGTSLWFDRPARLILARGRVICKPFKSSHEARIKLVTDFDWLKFSVLAGIEEERREIVRDSLFVDEVRSDAVCTAIMERCRLLENAALAFCKQVFIENMEGDVKENIAYSGQG